MYHPPSRRRQLTQRIVVYGVMSIAVVSLVTVLVLVMLGYQFNQSAGRIEQGGLVQFDSRPNGATVTIDNTSFGSHTPTKTTMRSGVHSVVMERNGYKTWQKSIDLTPGSVLWLNYARLIPDKLNPSRMITFPTISDTAVSPDSKWMAIKEHQNDSTIGLVNLSGEEVKMTSIELPASLYSKPTFAKGEKHSFKLVKWDPSSRYILVKHSYSDSKQEWLLVDSQDVGDSQNITRLLEINASEVAFGDDSKVLYALVDGAVRRIDVGAATVSRPLVDDVAEFSIHDSTIVFTTQRNAKTSQQSIGYLTERSEKPQIVRTFVNKQKRPLHAAMDVYFNHTFFAVAYGAKITILQLDLQNFTESRIEKTMTLADDVNYLSIATDGRFIVAQSARSYTTHDLELEKTVTTTLKGRATLKHELAWLDEYILWSDQDNMLRLYEFDGANQHSIMPVATGLKVSLSPNGKYLYGIARTDGAYHLNRVQLLID